MPNLEDITMPEYIDIVSNVESASKQFSTEIDPDMSALLKSLSSKNITLSQWNAAVTQLGLTSADVRRAYDILKKIAEDLDSNLDATNAVTSDLISAVQNSYAEFDAIAKNHEQRIADEETKSADHGKRLEDIEEYISDMPIEDKSVAYRKPVPIKSRSKANVLSIGGMTYKTKNLVDVGTVTFSAYKHFDVFLPAGKVYYISTRVTSNDTDDPLENTIRLKFEDDTYYFIGLHPRGTRVKFKTPLLEKNVIQLTLFAGQNFPTSEGDTATYEDFMLCEEDTDVYEPYFAGLRHTKVTEIKSEGAQLIPFPYRDNIGAGYTTTHNGITFTVLDDGRVMANGTATGNARFSITRKFALPKGVVKISGGVTVDGVDSKAYVVVTAELNGKWVAERTSIGTGKFVLTAYEYDNNDIYLMVLNGTTLNNAIFDPMVSFYQEASLPYKPYKAEPLDTLALPTSAQSLDGCDVGVNADYNNHFEFVDGKVFYHNVCKEVVFDGTENWLASDTMTAGVCRCYLEHGLSLWYKDTVTASPAVCNKYEGISASNTYNRVRGLSVTRNDLFIYDENYNTSDISLWKAHLAELYASGDPITAVVVLETPIVTDVTHLFSGDNVLNVEEGGYLTFENEYKYAVPSSVEWRIKSSHKIAFEHSQTKGNPHETTAAEVGAYSREEADNKFILLEDGKVPSRMLPSYVDDVLEYSSRAAFPEYGESGKIYIDLFTNKSYRWSGTAYVELTSSELILGETSETAYRGDRGKIAYDHSQTSGNPHATTLDDIVPVTEEDNDKILQVVGGVWEAAELKNFLPEVGESDEGKVLQVAGGNWSAADNVAKQADKAYQIVTLDGTNLKLFIGTRAEYNALSDKSNILAFPTDDTTKEDITNAISALETWKLGVEDGTIAVGKAVTLSRITNTYTNVGTDGLFYEMSADYLYVITACAGGNMDGIYDTYLIKPVLGNKKVWSTADNYGSRFCYDADSKTLSIHRTSDGASLDVREISIRVI